MKSHVVLLSGLLLVAPAAAQTAGTDAATDRPSTQEGTSSGNSSAEAENDPNRRICRKVETNTGSRVPHRTLCMTERQWRNYRAN